MKYALETSDVDNFERRSEKLRVIHEMAGSPPAIQSEVFKRPTFDSIVETLEFMYSDQSGTASRRIHTSGIRDCQEGRRN